jgi:hypothetical protein
MQLIRYTYGGGGGVCVHLYIILYVYDGVHIIIIRRWDLWDVIVKNEPRSFVFMLGV